MNDGYSGTIYEIPLKDVPSTIYETAEPGSRINELQKAALVIRMFQEGSGTLDRNTRNLVQAMGELSSQIDRAATQAAVTSRRMYWMTFGMFVLTAVLVLFGIFEVVSFLYN